MATTAIEYINLRAPYFGSHTNINELIEEAEKETGNVFGDIRYKAVALLVMHWLELEKRAGDGTEQSTVGSIKSMKEGDLSISYGSEMGTKVKDPYLAQTTWGIELYNLSRAKIQTFGNRFFI